MCKQIGKQPPLKLKSVYYYQKISAWGRVSKEKGWELEWDPDANPY